MQVDPYNPPLSTVTNWSGLAPKSIYNSLSLKNSIVSGLVLYFIMASFCCAVFYFTPITLGLHYSGLDFKQITQLAYSSEWFGLYTFYNALFIVVASAWAARLTHRFAYGASLSIGFVVLSVVLLSAVLFPEAVSLLPFWCKVLNVLIILPAALLGALIRHLVYLYSL